MFTFLFKKLWDFLKTKGFESQAIEHLKDAITLTQEEFVTFAKRASEDGKLSPEERQQARDLAISKALELAKGPAKDVLVEWGKPKLEALIGRIVRTNQAAGIEGK